MFHKDPTFLTQRFSVLLKQPKFFPNTYDFIAFIFIISLLALIAMGVSAADQSLARLAASPITLSVSNLPKYALYTTLRLFAAIFLSLLFTFIVGTWAAKSRRAEMLIIPLVDILQSVPVLGFLAFTASFFIGIYPGRQYGAELAAIFAVFTAQAWNMVLSLYQSLRSVPQDLSDVAGQFCLNPWQKFWRLEVPFAIPGLVWNTMMSMSGSWFFIVASEAISVGNIQITLPGIGSWLALAIQTKNLSAVGWAILAMAVVIILYDQLIFRPIVTWSYKFNLGQTASNDVPRSWIYDIMLRTKVLHLIIKPVRRFGYRILCLRAPHAPMPKLSGLSQNVVRYKVLDMVWYVILSLGVAMSSFLLVRYLHHGVTLEHVTVVITLGLITLLRVIILVFLTSLLWVPVGIWVGLRPQIVALVQPAAQFLAAFPANVLFPFFVVLIMQFQLDPDIWLSPLLILGTQWYIFFNVVAGVSIFPNDLKEAAAIYHINSWTWWRRVMLPHVLPYYITGAITAAGGAWNASIVAEFVNWGSSTIMAHGIGAYIALATKEGAFHRVILGVAIMSIIVVIINRIFWRRLYAYSAKLSGLDL